MIRFKSFLTEDVSVEKVIHLDHLEDLPILYGRDGTKRAVSILNGIISKLKNVDAKDIQIKTKFDGAPSIIAGINPANKKFFVGTKSVFNKLNPKINYSFEDIDKNHEQPELRKKLKYALKYLKNLGIRNIIQGDLMFTPGDVKTKTVDGVESFVFRPNTITYVVPKASVLGKEIARAKVGIIFHTKYRGTDIKNLQADLDIDTSILNKTPAVWFENADFQMIQHKGNKLDPKKMKIIEKDMNDLKFALDTLDKVLLDKVESDKELKDLMLEFINFLVRTDHNKVPAKEKLKLFAQYIHDKYSFDAESRKTEKGKNRLSKKLEYVQDVVRHNLKAFAVLFAVHRIISDVKLQLIQAMGQKDDIKSYLDIDDKLVKTSPEGFVAVSDSYGTVKLIDRDEFSKHNFNLEKNWKES